MKYLQSINDLEEATHRVPAGTFTPKKVQEPGLDKYDPKYDWRNPNHNPSGKKPEGKPHSYEGKYRKDKYPVIDTEHGFRLFEPDFVEHMKGTYPNWNRMSELDQIKCQLSFVQPMPQGKVDFDKESAALNKKALAMQAKIER